MTLKIHRTEKKIILDTGLPVTKIPTGKKRENFIDNKKSIRKLKNMKCNVSVKTR